MDDKQTNIIKTIKLQCFTEDARGTLCVGEGLKQIPFEIKRFYYITDVPAGTERGGHAHKEISQALFCLKGSIRITLDNGFIKDEIVLSDPSIGVLLPPMLWHGMADFEKDTVLFIVASDYYKEEDYIRNYEDFIQRF